MVEEYGETYKKRSILFKASRRSRTLAGEGENSNPPDHHWDSQEYLEYFEDYNFSLTPLVPPFYPAIALSDGGSL